MSEINKLKAYLSSTFHMKDLGDLRYFLGLEIDRSANGFFVFQKKYTLDLLKEFGMQNSIPLKLPMDAHLKLFPDKGDPLQHPYEYQKLLDKLIYPTVTRPDICYHVHVLSQIMQQPSTVHMQASKRVLSIWLGILIKTYYWHPLLQHNS